MPQPNQNDAFRDNLNDVIAIVQKLGDVCQDLPELLGICKLALENDAQLRLLMERVQKK